MRRFYWPVFILAVFLVGCQSATIDYGLAIQRLQTADAQLAQTARKVEEYAGYSHENNYKLIGVASFYEGWDQAKLDKERKEADLQKEELLRYGTEGPNAARRQIQSVIEYLEEAKSLEEDRRSISW